MELGTRPPRRAGCSSCPRRTSRSSAQTFRKPPGEGCSCSGCSGSPGPRRIPAAVDQRGARAGRQDGSQDRPRAGLPRDPRAHRALLIFAGLILAPRASWRSPPVPLGRPLELVGYVIGALAVASLPAGRTTYIYGCAAATTRWRRAPPSASQPQRGTARRSILRPTTWPGSSTHCTTPGFSATRSTRPSALRSSALRLGTCRCGEVTRSHARSLARARCATLVHTA